MTTRLAEHASFVGLIVAAGALAAGQAMTVCPCDGSAKVAPVATVAPVASSAPTPSCEIAEYGRYVATSDKVYVEDAGSVTGVSAIIDDIVFVDTTRAIRAERGTGFGIRYLAHDVPEGASVRWRVRYPHVIRGFDSWTREVEAPAGEIMGHVLYDFDHDWEMVPGTWRIELDIGSQQNACSFDFEVETVQHRPCRARFHLK